VTLCRQPYTYHSNSSMLPYMGGFGGFLDASEGKLLSREVVANATSDMRENYCAGEEFPLTCIQEATEKSQRIGETDGRGYASQN